MKIIEVSENTFNELKDKLLANHIHAQDRIMEDISDAVKTPYLLDMNDIVICLKR